MLSTPFLYKSLSFRSLGKDGKALRQTPHPPRQIKGKKYARWSRVKVANAWVRRAFGNVLAEYSLAELGDTPLPPYTENIFAIYP